MKLQELYNLLAATGIPVAYSHFKEPMEPPFICYLVTETANFLADDQVYLKVNQVQIELYTDKKDLEAEAAIEDALDSANIPYQVTEVYIDSEQLFEKIYEIRVI